MAARATEPVVEIEVAEGGIEIVAPHQANHPPAQPDAFRVPGRSVDGLRRFNEFVGLALVILLGLRGSGLLGGLILCPQIAALRNGSADADKNRQSRRGDTLKDCDPNPRTNATHEVPD